MLVDREEVKIYEQGTDEESHNNTQNRLWILMFEDDDKVKIHEQSKDAPFFTHTHSLRVFDVTSLLELSIKIF